MKINTKWTAAIILILLPVVAVIAGEKPDEPGPGNQPEIEFVSRDIGGGGWLHSGTFHPLDSNIILVGSDQTGGIYRTDDFGEKWYPWNDGLQNYDRMMSMYVEDLIGIVEPDGTVAFYAATHGGLYRATEDGPWDWLGDDQSRDENDAVLPDHSLVFWYLSDYKVHREPISFSCLDWNGDNLIAAGAGRIRWGTSYETSHYPGISPDLLKDVLECDPDGADPDYPCNPELNPVWIRDLEHPENGWVPLETPEGFGTPRDISIARIDGNDYLAVATHTGIYLYDFTADEWHDLTDNLFWSGDIDRLPREVVYGSEMTAWSIHLTQRGSLFAAMQRLDGAFPSGVYHIYRAPFRTDSSWFWTGDHAPVYPHDESLWVIGLGDGYFSQPDLIYLTVVDGEGNDPDTLYLGDRRSSYGLFKGEQPLDFVNDQGPYPAHWTSSMTRIDWVNWYPADFDRGWLTIWGPQVIFHPAVMPGSLPHKLAVQFNGMMHVSGDGGSTWDQRYCEKAIDEDGEETGAWNSLGYNEHCTRGADFLSDGRPVFCAGDTGIFVSKDLEGSSYDHIHPKQDYDSIPTDDAVIRHEANHVSVRPNWNEGERDALFTIHSGMYRDWYGKLFMQLYDKDTGPSKETENWFNITRTLDDLDHYMFQELVFIDDITCLLSYIKYNGLVGGIDEEEQIPYVKEGYGVLKGKFVGWEEIDGLLRPTWSWVDLSVDAGLPDDDGTSTYVSQLLYNSYRGDRVFLALARDKSVGGGLYMLEPADSEYWEVIYDGDYLDGDEEDDGIWSDVDRYRDFRSLAQSRDGSWLYVGTRGFSSGIGGLLLCTNPSRAAEIGELNEDEEDPVVLDKWEILANDPENDIRPFEFYLNLPFWAEDYPKYNDAQNIDKHMTYVVSLAVDRLDRKVVYVGLSDEEGFSLREGLWRYDGKSWEHMSVGQPFEGMSISVLKTNPYVPGQLLVGTDGQGLYIGEFGDD